MFNTPPALARPADPVYPRILLEPPAKRRRGFAIGVLQLLAGLAALGFLLFTWKTRTSNHATTLAICGLYGMCGGAWKIATALRYRVLLEAQTLSVRDALQTKTIARAEVIGYHASANLGTPELTFLSLQGPGHTVRVAHGLQEESAVLAWKHGLHNLDADEVDAAVLALETAVYKPTRDGYAFEAIAAASRQLSNILMLSGGLIVCALAIGAPSWRALLLALSALLPLAALELHRQKPALCTMWKPFHPGRQADITLNLLVPTAALALVALYEGWIVPWSWWLPATPVLALALAAIFGFMRKGRQHLNAGGLLLIPYAGVLLALACDLTFLFAHP